MEFLERIKAYIPEEYEEFEKTLQNPMYQGLRVNQKKIDLNTFEVSFPFIDAKSNFCDTGYYIHKSLGNHPYHICGAYYLQEPSASSAVQVLDVQEDDVVLDLCAAPGGKSTQIASYLKSGYLLSNEIDAKRAQILLSNMERMGVMNFAITNTNSMKLASAFPSCFSKILVDAPCSGEGMMKKHSLASVEWSYENILFCAKRQKEILDDAYTMLQKDGILVYSTCTYAKEENEEIVASFLKSHPDMELLPITEDFGRCGFETEGMDASKVKRIFPMDHGEGHFVAKFKKTEGEIRNLPTVKNCKVDKAVKNFIESQLDVSLSNYYCANQSVYGMNRDFVDFKKIRCIRQGLFMGQLLKNRFEPEHAFYMCGDLLNHYLNKIELSLSEMDDFMHGLQIQKEYKKGYVAVCYKGIPFGHGKSDGINIKNKIPKGLRLMQGSHLLEESYDE